MPLFGSIDDFKKYLENVLFEGGLLFIFEPPTGWLALLGLVCILSSVRIVEVIGRIAIIGRALFTVVAYLAIGSSGDIDYG